MVSCEQPKRSIFWAEADCARSAPVASVFQNMVKLYGWVSRGKGSVEVEYHGGSLFRYILLDKRYHPVSKLVFGSAEPTYRMLVTFPHIMWQG